MDTNNIGGKRSLIDSEKKRKTVFRKTVSGIENGLESEDNNDAFDLINHEQKMCIT